MTEEELRAICKGCRERYPDGDFRGCPNYADVELVQHKQSQADLISKLEAELEQVKRERDAAVKDLNALRKKTGWKCDCCHYNDNYDRDVCCGCDYNNGNNWKWRGVKEGG